MRPADVVDWSNVDVGIFPRRGLSLEEMSAQQKDAAWALIEESLSVSGVETTRGIMRTEQTLLEMNGEPIRYGEEKYYITMMGIPSADEPWGWQLDGHHLVINYFVMVARPCWADESDCIRASPRSCSCCRMILPSYIPLSVTTGSPPQKAGVMTT